MDDVLADFSSLPLFLVVLFPLCYSTFYASRDFGRRTAWHASCQASHRRKKDVTFIDTNPDRCNQASAKLDCLAVNGSGTNPDVLREAGCEVADIFIALTDSDEVNLVSCALVSSQFKIPRTVAAIRSMSYSGTELTAPLLGINYIVNPFEEVSKLISDIVQSGVFLNSSTFPHTPFVLCSLPVTKGSPAVGLMLSQIRTKFQTEFVLSESSGERKRFFLPAEPPSRKGIPLPW
jgi:trk system potassium uptake protein TrkA